MNGDEFKQIEDLLRGLPLRPPSSELDLRVSAALQPGPVAVKYVWLGVAASAMLVAITAGVVWTMLAPGDPAEPPQHQPPAAQQQPPLVQPPVQPPEPPPVQPPQTPASTPRQARVVGRHVFYNRSGFDGHDPAADRRDDRAIAVDKRALMPGQTATFANYTSYPGGLNGIMIDVADLPEGALPGPDDFRFRAGNSDRPAEWFAALAPSSITVRRGEGVEGSHRITLVWPDAAVSNTWLEVTVRATANTGLAEDHVFYYGNAMGESGNSASDAQVDAYDMAAAQQRRLTITGPAAVDEVFDYNRDCRVDQHDTAVAQQNATHIFSALKLITTPDR